MGVTSMFAQEIAEQNGNGLDTWDEVLPGHMDEGLSGHMDGVLPRHLHGCIWGR